MYHFGRGTVGEGHGKKDMRAETVFPSVIRSSAQHTFFAALSPTALCKGLQFLNTFWRIVLENGSILSYKYWIL